LKEKLKKIVKKILKGLKSEKVIIILFSVMFIVTCSTVWRSCNFHSESGTDKQIITGLQRFTERIRNYIDAVRSFKETYIKIIGERDNYRDLTERLRIEAKEFERINKELQELDIRFREYQSEFNDIIGGLENTGGELGNRLEGFGEKLRRFENSIRGLQEPSQVENN
jgi:DNA repair ATPase RecN